MASCFDFRLLGATTEAIRTEEMKGKNLYVLYQLSDQISCEIPTIAAQLGYQHWCILLSVERHISHILTGEDTADVVWLKSNVANECLL